MTTKSADLPTLTELGTDLLITTPRQRWIALARPFIGVTAYIFAAYFGLWWLIPVIFFFIVVSVITVNHDAVHSTLGLTARQTDWVLFAMGVVLLVSGHSYYITHNHHHRIFPGDNDPEGYPSKMSLFGTLLYGPVFLCRLWWWAFHHNRGNSVLRLWLLVEGTIPILAIVSGILLWKITPALLLYSMIAIVASWLYPLATSHLPHKDYGDTLLTQSHTLRGRIIPALFLGLTYHLEHHLYPQVPSHHLAELARRLDPFFEQVGVKPWHVI